MNILKSLRIRTRLLMIISGCSLALVCMGLAGIFQMSKEFTLWLLAFFIVCGAGAGILIGMSIDSSLTNTNETWIALMLRYQTTHDRAFHKCLAELRTMRREGRNAAQSQAHATPPSQQEVPTRSAAAGHFESQNVATPPATPQFESQKPASPASESIFDATARERNRRHAEMAASSNRKNVIGAK